MFETSIILNNTYLMSFLKLAGVGRVENFDTLSPDTTASFSAKTFFLNLCKIDFSFYNFYLYFVYPIFLHKNNINYYVLCHKLS